MHPVIQQMILKYGVDGVKFFFLVVVERILSTDTLVKPVLVTSLKYGKG